jgi:Na+-translocating ferredoxin:NAD+ oxidoreductase RNF subunit RnfB
MTIVLLTALVALTLAFILGSALGFFKQVFHVEEDPLIGQIREALPGANCGGCGYPGCDGFAAAVAAGKAGISGCPPGGKALVESLAALVGGSSDVIPLVAFLACAGSHDKALSKAEYFGVKTCRASKLSTGSIKLCNWACQGYGDCVNICKFDAMVIGDDGLPRIDIDKCTGCKACVTECPQGIIKLIPKDQKGAFALCSNANVNKAQVTKSCKAGCFKCELCVKNCPETCMVMEKGIPVVDYAKCTSCGVCVEKCPKKVITLL